MRPTTYSPQLVKLIQNAKSILLDQVKCLETQKKALKTKQHLFTRVPYTEYQS